MRKLLALFCLLLAVPVFADPGDLDVGYQSVWTDFNSSYWTLGSIGQYRNAALLLYHPTNEIRFWSDNRSGGSLDEAMQRRMPMFGPAQWAQVGPGGYVFVHYCADNNGGYTPSTWNATIPHMFAYPGTEYDNTAYVSSTGWLAAHAGTFKFIIGGSEPVGGAASSHYMTGSADQLLDQAAIDSASFSPGPMLTFGVFYYLDSPLGGNWTNDILNETHYREMTKGIAIDDEHPGCSGAFPWAVNELNHLISTNIWSASIDWNSQAVTTNNCVISGLNKYVNTLSFSFTPERLSMPFDLEDATTGRTNTAKYAFVLNPGLSNAFNEVLVVSNCPDGIYQVMENGSNILSTTGAALRGGLNFFTVCKGAMWDKRIAVLYYMREKYGYDPITLVPSNGGTSFGEQTYQSNAEGLWPATRDDALISALQAEVNVVEAQDTNAWNAAAVTNYTITIAKFVRNFPGVLH